jgi:hypothetical protein
MPPAAATGPVTQSPKGAMSSTILTAQGTYFDLADPRPEAVSIEAIAHALSHICRYTGHCREFYSVAQHSVLVSYAVPPKDALAGLLHDAAEAYIGDVAKPLKRLLPDYQALEQRVEAAVFTALGLPLELPASVRHADLVLLVTEKRDLMPACRNGEWHIDGVQPLERTIFPLGPAGARIAFLDRFFDLTTP